MNTWSRKSSSSYTNAEERMDGIVQSVATVLTLLGVGWLIATHWQTAAMLGLTIYATCLVMTFVASLIYTHFSSGRSKERWRQLDHAAIFALIAGTYTPLAAYRLPYPWNLSVFALIWGAAIAGIGLKFIYPRRFEYTGLTLCIVMSLIGMLFVRTLSKTLMSTTFALLIAGIGLYLIGTIILQMHRMRFHNAIWHLLVFAGAGIHFAAMATEFAVRQ